MKKTVYNLTLKIRVFSNLTDAASNVLKWSEQIVAALCHIYAGAALIEGTCQPAEEPEVVNVTYSSS